MHSSGLHLSLNKDSAHNHQVCKGPPAPSGSWKPLHIECPLDKYPHHLFCGAFKKCMFLETSQSKNSYERKHSKRSGLDIVATNSSIKQDVIELKETCTNWNCRKYALFFTKMFSSSFQWPGYFLQVLCNSSAFLHGNKIF